jgi:hypothetical protein
MTLYFLGVFYLVRLGDGVFDKLTNKVISQTAWNAFNEQQSIHSLTGNAAKEIIKTALAHKT